MKSRVASKSIGLASLKDLSKSGYLDNYAKPRQNRTYENLPLHDVLALTGQRLSFKESFGIIHTNSLKSKRFNSTLITDVRQCGVKTMIRYFSILVTPKS